MKHLFTAFLILTAGLLQAQSVGQFTIPLKTSTTGPATPKHWTKGNLTLWGTNASGNPVSYTLGDGLSFVDGALVGSGGGGAGTWGSITGTLSAQTDLQSALNAKAPLASPTFTGTVTIPSGASIAGYLTTAAAVDAYQPLDADLTDLADGTLTGSKVGTGINAGNITTGALAITNGGTGSTTAANARAALGLAIGTDVQAYSANTSLLGSSIDLTTEVTGALPIANGGTGSTTALDARAALGLAIGTDVQAYSANTSLLGSSIDLTTEVTGALPIANGGTGSTTAAAARAALGLAIGTDVQAYSANTSLLGSSIDLTTEVTGALPIANGGTNATTAPNARTALGLAIGTDVQAYDADLADLADGSLSGSKVGSGIDAGNITTGTVATGRLGSGTADSTKFLRGDQTWQTVSGGLASVTETLHTSSPNNTINALELAVTGGSTNVDLVLSPKGTGALIGFGEPDNSATGGAKRGAYAVDLQGPWRNNSADIASGVSSGLLWGRYNKVTSQYGLAGGYLAASTGGSGSMAAGYQATASANYAAVFGGVGCVASGASSFIGGGQAVTASGSYSRAGGYNALADRYGMDAWSNGAFSTQGDAQRGSSLARATTVGNTPTNLLVDGSITRFTVPSGKVMGLMIFVVTTASDGTASYFVRKAIIRNATGTTSLLSSETIGTDYEADSATDLEILADDDTDSLVIRTTNLDSISSRTLARIEWVEMTY
ncbi:hypothetical protein GCM10023213_13930 [Prosthecobacter algae]|uniref:Trimeric autotransporter adhesin n=1 Tax=Prosthecobacter algae TaxID=1144682 RepID=A0ABP9NZD5_9BACT